MCVEAGEQGADADDFQYHGGGGGELAYLASWQRWRVVRVRGGMRDEVGSDISRCGYKRMGKFLL